ncbi:MAG: response regulator [Mesorhizobium sp.]|nr:response regulator [Mesorhizobium sp.]
MVNSVGSEETILIVEDDVKIRNMLENYLRSEGYRAFAVSSASELHDEYDIESVDLVLLDIGLPGEDGLSLARRLRNNPHLGIIMLSGRSDIVDRIVGIEVGADDYISKPFHLREVLARVKAVLRRVRGNRKEARGQDANGHVGAVISFGDYKLFVDQRRLVNKQGEDVVLTSGEFDILLALVRNAGRVLSRDQLLDMTKGPGWIALDRTIDAQIARLRKKIEPDPRRPLFVKSVRGSGYQFSAKMRHMEG